MKQFNEFVLERLKLNNDSKVKRLNPKTKEAYGELGEKWFDICKNFSISGSWYWTKPRLTISDFDGFIEDFEKSFKPPSGNSYYDQLSQIRYEICQHIKQGEIEDALELIKSNDIRHFMYGEDPDSEHTYGSYMLDCYMYLVSLRYIKTICPAYYSYAVHTLLDLERTFNWWDNFEKLIKNCKNIK